uniref:Uncharacterized protein n=1 Tax=Oryza barthii TaxID=65489 RepID=A0A0D3G1C8_9ORYZ
MENNRSCRKTQKKDRANFFMKTTVINDAATRRRSIKKNKFFVGTKILTFCRRDEYGITDMPRQVMIKQTYLFRELKLRFAGRRIDNEMKILHEQGMYDWEEYNEHKTNIEVSIAAIRNALKKYRERRIKARVFYLVPHLTEISYFVRSHLKTMPREEALKKIMLDRQRSEACERAKMESISSSKKTCAWRAPIADDEARDWDFMAWCFMPRGVAPSQRLASGERCKKGETEMAICAYLQSPAAAQSSCCSLGVSDHVHHTASASNTTLDKLVNLLRKKDEENNAESFRLEEGRVMHTLCVPHVDLVEVEAEAFAGSRSRKGNKQRMSTALDRDRTDARRSKTRGRNDRWMTIRGPPRRATRRQKNQLLNSPCAPLMGWHTAMAATAKINAMKKGISNRFEDLRLSPRNCKVVIVGALLELIKGTGLDQIPVLQAGLK